MQTDITDQVDVRNTSALNESRAGSAKFLFAGDRTLACRSDADSQLLITLPFLSTVRLSSIFVDGPVGERPTIAKLYVNRATLGFDELDDVEPTQVCRVDMAASVLPPDNLAARLARRVAHARLTACASTAHRRSFHSRPIRKAVAGPVK